MNLIMVFRNNSIRFFITVFMVYFIRELIYILTFSYLGQGIKEAMYRMFYNPIGSTLFIFPSALLNFIVTGIPLYILLKQEKKRFIIILPFVDFILNWNIYNLENNVSYQLIRAVLFVVSLHVLLLLNDKKLNLRKT